MSYTFTKGDKMNNKILIILLALLLLVFGIFVGYSMDNPQMIGDSSKKVELNVSSEGPFNLSQLIDDVENESYYEGYDNETLNWMKSLGQKSVFHSMDYIVIMDSNDASQLHSEFVTDVAITEFFECKVLENRSLGDVKYPKDVLLVNDVKYLHENITYYDV